VKLSVVIPVHNGREYLSLCLQALRASERLPDEVIVVDDSSTDGSGQLAAEHSATLVTLKGGPHGPAVARNRGARQAMGDILVFIDSDVVVHPDTLQKIERILTAEPDISALFGSYDADSPANGVVTRYKNLLHHYVHQHSAREVCTFWAGCGAIRRDVFLDVGGFDESYGRPSIEDIELGARLRKAGLVVWLCSDVQATHLKRWTLGNLLVTDIRDRAVPWTRLIVRSKRLPADLNLSPTSRWSAVAAWAIVLSAGLGFWFPLAWVGVLGALIGLAWLNSGLYRFFFGNGGAVLALGGTVLHLVYLLYSSLVFAMIAVPTWLGRRGLAVLLAATLLKGLAWSVIVPPWHAPDEMQHLFYAQIIERFHTLEVRPDNHLPREADVLYQLAQIREVRFVDRPLDLSDQADIAATKALLEEADTKWTYRYADDRSYTIARRFVLMHPPLYYLLQAPVQAAFEGRSVLFRLLASRWLSVLMGLVTVILAYATGRELWPRRPGAWLLLATMVGFQPMFAFVSSVMGSLVLEVALFSGCMLLTLRVIQRGLTTRRAVLLGVWAGSGLLVRTSFLAVIPLIAGVALRDIVRCWRSRSRIGWQWAWAAALPVLLAGWWYAEPLLTGGEAVLASFGAALEQSDIAILPYLMRYGWLTVYQSQIGMYWGNFGWLDTPLPSGLLTALIWMTVAASWTAGWWAVRRLRRASSGVFPLLLLAGGTLSLIVFFSLLDYRAISSRGGTIDLQGRYFLPAIIGQMAWLSVGLLSPAPAAWRRYLGWLVGCGMVALNGFALLRIVLPRYYRPGGLLTLLERAAILQPVSYHFLLVACVAAVGLAVLLVLALWGAWDAFD